MAFLSTTATYRQLSPNNPNSGLILDMDLSNVQTGVFTLTMPKYQISRPTLPSNTHMVYGDFQSFRHAHVLTDDNDFNVGFNFPSGQQVISVNASYTFQYAQFNQAGGTTAANSIHPPQNFQTITVQFSVTFNRTLGTVTVNPTGQVGDVPSHLTFPILLTIQKLT